MSDIPDELWALCYLHDWDPPQEGQEHKWEPGKNVFPEIHAFYRTWQEAESVRQDMERSKDKYWVVRARPESETRQTKANLRLRPSMDDLKKAYDKLRKGLEWYANAEVFKASEHGIAFDRRDLSYVARDYLAEADAILSNQDQPT